MVREFLPDDLQSSELELARMVRDALVRYIEEYGHVRATTSTILGERINIHNCMSAISKTRFDYIQKGNLFLIKIGRYLVRPKKFSEKLETSNNPTQGSFNFENQITHTLFPEFEPINLNVGYVPDLIDPRNSSLWLTQPGPNGWEYRLRLTAGEGALPALPATDPNQGEAPKQRIKAKRPKKTQDSEQDE